MESDNRSRIYIHNPREQGFDIIYPSHGATTENVNLRADYVAITNSTHKAEPGRKLGRLIKREWSVKPSKEGEDHFYLKQRGGENSSAKYLKLVEELERISGRHDLTIIVG